MNKITFFYCLSLIYFFSSLDAPNVTNHSKFFEDSSLYKSSPLVDILEHSSLQSGKGKNETFHGVFYGMTSNYGFHGGGVIFSFDVATGGLTEIQEVGKNAYGSLMQASNGKLYGMSQGGTKGNGFIFSVDPATNTFSIIKEFLGDDGRNPRGNLMQASDGKLYGMTVTGGTNSVGVIFSLDPVTGSYNKLRDFNKSDGPMPRGTLIQASDGKLYGTTGSNMSNEIDVIFSFDPVSSEYTKLYEFDKKTDQLPFGSLLQASNGKLYGTCSGGVANSGVIFSFDLKTHTYAKLKDIENSHPYSGLIQANDGKLYGTTVCTGIGGFDGIFSFDPATNTYDQIKALDRTTGMNSYGELLQASDGKLYGMTSMGITGGGVIFSFDPVSKSYSALKEFTGLLGHAPRGSLILPIIKLQ